MSGAVAVIGAGNGGLAFAAFLARAGLDVRLFDNDPEVLRPLAVGGCVRLLSDGAESFEKLGLVTQDLAAALAGVRWVMVATPATSHAAVAEAVAPLAEDGCKVVLNPGRTGGALEVRYIFDRLRPNNDITVAEAQTLLFACRKPDGATVQIHGRKARVAVAALPAAATDPTVELMRTVFPEFTPARSVLETSLMNIGAMFHPLPMLCNLGRVESDRQGFAYYLEGISPTVAALIERLDGERIAVAAALGLELARAVDWLAEVYGVRKYCLYEAIQLTPAYAAIRAPGAARVRYLTEDVPTGLVPLAALGELVGVPTPTMNAVIHLAGMVTGTDYTQSGRNLARLGLEGFSRERLLAYAGF